MIYTGDYQNDYIYGTLKKHSIVIETEDNATYLSCDLSVLFNGTTWQHVFEIPFYNNMATCYFENYVHSLITQKFGNPDINLNEISINSFQLARVVVNIEEKNELGTINSQILQFYMTLGNFDKVSLDLLENSNKKTALPISHTSFVSQNGAISFSFLSKTLPTKFRAQDSESTKETVLSFSATILYLHTITIPIVSFIQSNLTEYALSISFLDNTNFSLGTFHIIDNVVDHHQIAYQNQFGSISTIEFFGETIRSEEFNTRVEEFANNNSVVLRESDISESFPFSINTGYIWDSEKHTMLKMLIGSFNKFLIENGQLISISNNGLQKLTPYQTKNYLKEETLKFKLSTNDNSANRLV